MDICRSRGNIGIMKTEEEINDLIDKWHDGDSEMALHEYLGMTWDEYKLFVENE